MTRKAIIIEDDLLIALELEDILESLGFAIGGTFVTEDEAVRGALEQRPDLLLVDFRLAVGNGVSVVERIDGALDARIVFVTANNDELRRRRPDAIRVDKPFDREMIERAIRTAFAGAPGGSDPDGGAAIGPSDSEPARRGTSPDDLAGCASQRSEILSYLWRPEAWRDSVRGPFTTR